MDKDKEVYEKKLTQGDLDRLSKTSKGIHISDSLMAKIFDKFQEELKFFWSKKDNKLSAMFIKTLRGYLVHSNKEEDKTFFESIEIGDIYMVNFTFGFENEISFIHPGLVVEKNDNFLYVVPGSSSLDPTQSFHPDKNNKISKNKYLLLPEETLYLKNDLREPSGKKEISLDKETTFLLENLHSINSLRISNRLKIGDIKNHPRKILKEIRSVVFKSIYKDKDELINDLKEELEYYYYISKK